LVIVAYGNDQNMTFENDANATSTPAILTPEVQQAVWFLGALVRVRTGGDSFVIITASGQLNGMIRAATPYGSRCNRG
jgi:hypothetical protein